jgi:membrane protein
MRGVWALLKATYAEWSEDRVPRLAAALAYYTTFSIAPLLVIIIAIAGFVFGAEAVRGQLDEQIRGLLGSDAASAVQDMVQSATANASAGILATVLSIAALLFGATGVFAELQDSLNTIWEVQPKSGRGLRGLVRDRLLSFGMVLAIAFLLIVSLVASAAIAGMGTFIGSRISALAPLWHVVDVLVSIGVLALLFAAIFKWLPDVEIGWRDVWVGALVTSLLFTVGKTLLGLYLGRSATASVYGTAGALVILLLWVYYSAQIFFFGAELTQVYANRYGSRVVPSPNAEPVTEEARAQQGMPRRPDAQHRPGPRRPGLATR